MTAAQLARALKRLELSQSEAARRLHVEQSTMFRWLAGHRAIPGPVEAAVAAWLELAAWRRITTRKPSKR